MRNQYDAATTGRRAKGWIAPGTGPNRALNNGLATLRNRARAGERNNPWLYSGLLRLVTNEIGTGIRPRSQVKDVNLRAEINALWQRSYAQFDPEGQLNFYTMQPLMAAARRLSGEVFVRRLPRKIDRVRAVPMQYQILEADHVPLAKNEKLANGNRVIAGIEFNPIGQRAAYWMLTDHPGEDSSGGGSDAVRVPATDVIHHFRPKRPGQVRGEPDTVRSLLKARDFDDYDDAELLRKKTRAPFTGFLTRAEFTEDDYIYDPFTGKSMDGSDQPPELDMQAGNILQGLPGEELKLFDGDDTGGGYADFMRQQLLAIAAGMGIPFELLTGDWKNVNDRLVRAILNEFRRQIEMDQELFTSQCCWRMWGWWMDAAVVAGALRVPGYANDPESYRLAEWTPDPWPYINPEMDVNTAQKEIDAGLASRDQHIVRRGRDPQDVDREQAEGELRRRDIRTNLGLPADEPNTKTANQPAQKPQPDPNQD